MGRDETVVGGSEDHGTVTQLVDRDESEFESEL